jgi:hypothetical protein
MRMLSTRIGWRKVNSLVSTRPTNEREKRIKEEDFFSRLEALRVAYQTTGRVIVDDPNLRVSFDHSPSARLQDSTPAFSIGNRVTLRTSLIPDIHKHSGLVLMSGLSYHEFSHVIFGPSTETIAIASFSVAQRRAFEILEEGRVEMLMQSKYGKLGKYFAYPVITYFVNDASQHATAFLYTHGRKYLPKDIRDMFRKKFEDIHGTYTTMEIGRVIDYYLGVIYPQSKILGLKLINELTSLLIKAQLVKDVPAQNHQQIPTTVDAPAIPMDSGEQEQLSNKLAEKLEGQRETEKGGKDGSGFREETKSDTDDDSAREPESDSDAPLEDESGEDTEDSEAEDDSSGQDSSPQSSGDVDGARDYPDTSNDPYDSEDGSDDENGGTEPTGETWDSSDDADYDSDDDFLKSAGTTAGNNSAPPMTQQEISEALTDLLQEIETNDDVADEVRRLTNVMNDSNLVQTSLAPVRFLDRDVTPKMRSISNKIREEFSRLYAFLDPGWNYGAESGRLNINRAAMANDIDDYETMYDSWEEGFTEQAGIELFFCGDRSGSMHGKPVVLMSQSLWIIGNACSVLDSKVTVTAFDGNPNVVYERTEKIDDSKWREISADGGTNPTSNLVEARKVFRASAMPNKVLVMITDGVWSGAETEYKRLLEDDMSEVTKVLILITDRKSISYISVDTLSAAKYFQVRAQIDTAADIPPVIAETVNGILRRLQR